MAYLKELSSDESIESGRVPLVDLVHNILYFDRVVLQVILVYLLNCEIHYIIRPANYSFEIIHHIIWLINSAVLDIYLLYIYGYHHDLY